MKKILLFFVSLSILNFTSCSSDNDANEKKLIGIWKLVSIKGRKVDKCQQQTRLEFTDNEYLLSWHFHHDSCGQETDHGVWKEMGEETYSLKSDNGKVHNVIISFIDSNTIRFNVVDDYDNHIYKRIGN
ncbi:MAG: lipocalin family protein [Flavobacteriaceae bacterium]|nr:lipocalin family protein [Flavobacteriaceae bacterium]